MTQIDDLETGEEARYETPAFDPRSAFAWTLRSGAIARRQRRPEPEAPSRGDEATGPTSDTAPLARETGAHGSAGRRYETQAFDPRSAFARTLRAGEIARLAREQRPPRSPLDLLLGAF